MRVTLPRRSVTRVTLSRAVPCSSLQAAFPANPWPGLLEEFKKPYMSKLCRFLSAEYVDWNVYPPRKDIFTAFRLTALKDTKVVILGQDPYHNSKHAMGLAFSVPANAKSLPRSLSMIYRELEHDPEVDRHKDAARKVGDLTRWARQGVLLMNTVLTVGDAAGSHNARGWETFTNKAIELLNDRDKSLVFLLWGKNAQKKTELITNPRHCVLLAAHPRVQGFLGCRHFSRTNTFLKKHGFDPILW
jgi:uracil-DNA glycosylase